MNEYNVIRATYLDRHGDDHEENLHPQYVGQDFDEFAADLREHLKYKGCTYINITLEGADDD